MEDVLLWIFCEADTKVELEILRFAGGVGGYLQDKREKKQDKQEGNLISVKKDGLNIRVSVGSAALWKSWPGC